MKRDHSPQKGVRPTTGKVREALFDILGERIAGARFLDLYAGTGNVGLGALQRGAAQVVFVDASRSNGRRINELIQRLGYSERAQVVTKKVLSFIELPGPNAVTFDIIFLDPPYHSDEVLNALRAIDGSPVLDKNSSVIAEHFKKQSVPEHLARLCRIREYRYGDSILSLYKPG